MPRIHSTAFSTPRGSVHGRPRPIRPSPRAEEEFEHGPLRISEVHAAEYDGDLTDLSGPALVYDDKL